MFALSSWLRAGHHVASPFASSTAAAGPGVDGVQAERRRHVRGQFIRVFMQSLAQLGAMERTDRDRFDGLLEEMVPELARSFALFTEYVSGRYRPGRHDAAGLLPAPSLPNLTVRSLYRLLRDLPQVRGRRD